MPIVAVTRLVHAANVWILVRVLVVTMPFVRLSITYPCADARRAQLEVPLLDVLLSKVIRPIYFLKYPKIMPPISI